MIDGLLGREVMPDLATRFLKARVAGTPIEAVRLDVENARFVLQFDEGVPQ